jgi:hypothetical protein
MLVDVARPSDDPVELAREFFLRGGRGSVSNDLEGTSRMASLRERVGNEPAWIADQFLHPYEAVLTMEALLSLLGNALAVVGAIMVAAYQVIGPGAAGRPSPGRLRPRRLGYRGPRPRHHGHRQRGPYPAGRADSQLHPVRRGD